MIVAMYGQIMATNDNKHNNDNWNAEEPFKTHFHSLSTRICFTPVKSRPRTVSVALVTIISVNLLPTCKEEETSSKIILLSLRTYVRIYNYLVHLFWITHQYGASYWFYWVVLKGGTVSFVKCYCEYRCISSNDNSIFSHVYKSTTEFKMIVLLFWE